MPRFRAGVGRPCPCCGQAPPRPEALLEVKQMIVAIEAAVNARYERLRRENDELRARLAAATAGTPTPVGTGQDHLSNNGGNHL